MNGHGEPVVGDAMSEGPPPRALPHVALELDSPGLQTASARFSKKPSVTVTTVATGNGSEASTRRGIGADGKEHAVLPDTGDEPPQKTQLVPYFRYNFCYCCCCCGAPLAALDACHWNCKPAAAPPVDAALPLFRALPAASIAMLINRTGS